MIGAGKAAAALACLGLLAACGASGDWAKPGTDPAETAAAYRDCTALAAPVIDRDVSVDEDILASRSADAERSAAVRTDNSMMQDDTRRSGDKIIASCMREKGFTERP